MEDFGFSAAAAHRSAKDRRSGMARICLSHGLSNAIGLLKNVT
jgi:hypothetical protein